MSIGTRGCSELVLSRKADVSLSKGHVRASIIPFKSKDYEAHIKSRRTEQYLCPFHLFFIQIVLIGPEMNFVMRILLQLVPSLYQYVRRPDHKTILGTNNSILTCDLCQSLSGTCGFGSGFTHRIYGSGPHRSDPQLMLDVPRIGLGDQHRNLM
jgi:hypothetical protein